jgi:hypothetical protein
MGMDQYSVKNGANFADFSLVRPAGKKFNSGDGRFLSQFRDISIEQKGNEPMTWKATISNFDAENFRLDSMGKTGGKLLLKSAALKEFKVSSATMKHIPELTTANTSFQLSRFTGNYLNADSRFHWYNAGFDRSSNSFSLDSFSFRPVLDKIHSLSTNNTD